MLFKKKFLASSVTAAAVATAVIVPAASADTISFQDVSSKYTDAVDFLVANDITQGFSSTQFGTTHSIKRVDAAVLIAKAIGFQENWDYEDSGFKDVPRRAKWAVDALVEIGVIDGLNAKEFGSDALLTRNQTAKILANAADLDIDDSIKKSNFTDVNSNFAKYVEALVKAAITQGKTTTSFGANDHVTRGELALFIHRAKEHFGFLDLFVMHTNDTHGYLDSFPYLATPIQNLRKEHRNTLLLHAGDVFSGDLYFNAFHGEADLAMMNHLGYDAMVFGNHEFDLGSSQDGHLALSNFVKGADFPFVAANVDFSKDALFDGLQTKDVEVEYDNGHIYDGVVLNVNGNAVGLFGLTTEETPSISSTGKVEFSNYIDRAKEAVEKFEEMGVDKIIALTHLGLDDSLDWDNDIELAKQVEGIDIIVGGHTHSTLFAPYVVEEYDAPTIIVQANEYGKFLGTLNVSFNQFGEVTLNGGGLIPTDPVNAAFDKDPETVKVLAPFTKVVDEMKAESIGVEALVDLDGGRDFNNEGISSVRHNETNLGNLMTDAMLAKAKTINADTSIAFQNGGGIRTSIPAGDITVGDVLKVMPFGNALSIVKMTGAEIRATLEHSVSADAIEGGKGLKESGGFLHVAGMKFTYDSTKEKGKRVVSVEVQNGDHYAALDDAKVYYVATNSFTARGGDGFKKFEEAYKDGRVSDPGFVDYENFIEYVKTLGDNIEPKLEGRITDAGKTE